MIAPPFFYALDCNNIFYNEDIRKASDLTLLYIMSQSMFGSLKSFDFQT